jgi:hypothetical protein
LLLALCVPYDRPGHLPFISVAVLVLIGSL